MHSELRSTAAGEQQCHSSATVHDNWQNADNCMCEPHLRSGPCTGTYIVVLGTCLRPPLIALSLNHHMSGIQCLVSWFGSTCLLTGMSAQPLAKLCLTAEKTASQV
jgi:hypothetical protein